MFKRVARRERKREKDEELGLNDAMKQVLGLQDTDSDESLDSRSDSESDDSANIGSDAGEESSVGDAGFTGHLVRKRKRSVRSSDSSPDTNHDHEDLDSVPEQSGARRERDMGLDEDDPPMSVTAATTEPIYDIQGALPTRNIRACIICPGKVIKTLKDTKEHLESKAHCRRLQKYTAEVSRRTSSAEGLNTDDPRDILRDLSDTVNSAQDGTSRRFQRRVQRMKSMEKRKKIQKEKKEKRKLMLADKSEKVYHETDDDGVMKKKGKKRAHVPTVTTEPLLTPKGDAGKDTQATPSRSGMELDPKQQIRPKKRRKRQAATDMDTALSIEPHSGSAPTKHNTKKIVEPLSHGKKRMDVSPLKRSSTSFYSGDDDKAQPLSTMAQSQKQSTSGSEVPEINDRKAAKPNPGPGSSQKRRVDISRDVGHRSDSQTQDAVDKSKKLKGKTKFYSKDKDSRRNLLGTKKDKGTRTTKEAVSRGR